MTILTLKSVSHSYPDGPDRVIALDQIDLSVRPGEFVAVMGPSGSGKTTLVNVAAGLELALRGSVIVDGVDLGRASAGQRAELRRRRIGVVHQEDELDPVLTALENVALPLLLDGVGRRSALAVAQVALERSAAGGLAERRRDQLSSGQRQRVALARAIVGDRVLVLADEPTASLDTATARALVERLASLTSNATAVLMTTHDSRLATYADRVVLLRDGRQVGGTATADDPKEVLRS